MLQPRHHGPLGAGHAEPARALVRIGAQQAGYIIEKKSKFAAGVARAHVILASLGYPHIIS